VVITTTSVASDDVPPIRSKDQQGAGCKACREAARKLGIGRRHNLRLLLGSSSFDPPPAGYNLDQEVGSTREISGRGDYRLIGSMYVAAWLRNAVHAMHCSPGGLLARRVQAPRTPFGGQKAVPPAARRRRHESAGLRAGLHYGGEAEGGGRV
jgi:hypothetical protein